MWNQQREGDMTTLQAPRLPIQSLISFTGDVATGAGRVTDLTASGCTVETMDRVDEGDYLALRLQFPGEAPPMETDLATVRWVHGWEAGLDFIHLSSETQSRLRQFTTVIPLQMPESRWFRVPVQKTGEMR